MKNVYIWGAGYYAEFVYSVMDKTACSVNGIIDSDKTKQGMLWNGELRIHPPEQLTELEFDCLVISVQKYEEIEQKCKSMGIPDGKIVSYWKDAESRGLFENRTLQILKERHKTEIYKNRLESAPYEWGLKPVPKILPGEELLKKIAREKSSLCRFGDGEFEIMRGNERPWFQNVSSDLQERLFEVLNSEEHNVNIAIAQDFMHMEKYTDEAADIIRDYMSNGTREAILKFVKQDRFYYDAYVSRPYIMYKEKKNAEIIFPLFENLWNGRQVVIVEGEYARIGINNDLFDRSAGIKRILCPAKNAWDFHDEIIGCVLDVAQKEDLICISLGPAATVLAYDLACEGYWALDIGQLDNEYDWYLKGARERVAIPGKMVAEIQNNGELEEFKNFEYKSQIVARVF